jgi:hypothetical protein
MSATFCRPLHHVCVCAQLFSAATVEERILANAAKKRKLEAVVCARKGHGANAELSPAELRACLTHGGLGPTRTGWQTHVLGQTWLVLCWAEVSTSDISFPDIAQLSHHSRMLMPCKRLAQMPPTS